MSTDTLHKLHNQLVILANERDRLAQQNVTLLVRVALLQEALDLQQLLEEKAEALPPKAYAKLAEQAQTKRRASLGLSRQPAPSWMGELATLFALGATWSKAILMVPEQGEDDGRFMLRQRQVTEYGRQMLAWFQMHILPWLAEHPLPSARLVEPPQKEDPDGRV